MPLGCRAYWPAGSAGPFIGGTEEKQAGTMCPEPFEVALAACCRAGPPCRRRCEVTRARPMR